jgi:hypothetical protein
MANCTKKAPDYSIAATLGEEEKLHEHPRIERAFALTVTPQDVRCAKGDCNKDYAPG